MVRAMEVRGAVGVVVTRGIAGVSVLNPWS
jgi:hypothetical protein